MAEAFAEGEVGALIFGQSGAPPRSRQGAAGGVEGSGADDPGNGGHNTGQLELEGGAAVCLGTIGRHPEPNPCLNYLHRLGFVLKRPKKRLLKTGQQQREPFVAEYAALWD